MEKVFSQSDQQSKHIYLASISPQRTDLLAQMGIDATICPSAIDETPRKGESPRLYAQRMALDKAHAATALLSENLARDGAVVITADTVVAAGRRILPKTDIRDIAEQHLRLLSGRRHRIYGGLAVADYQDGAWRYRQRMSITAVQFQRLKPSDIDDYLAHNEWQGCAGGYGIQGRAGMWVKQIIGSYTNVVGMDIHQLAMLLKSLSRPG